MKSLLTILLVVASIALVILVARPWWDEIRILRAEQSAVSDTLAALKDLQNLRDDLLKTYDGIPLDKLKKLEKLLPQKTDVGTLLVTLEKMASDRGIRLRRIEFAKDPYAQNARSVPLSTRSSGGQSGLFASTIPFTLTVSANYESFRSFLTALEKNLRVIDISDVSFSGGGSEIVDFTLKAVSYYQKK